MKYCETCAGVNDDNAMECKYCHTKFDIGVTETSVELNKNYSNDTSSGGDLNSYAQPVDDSCSNSYINSLSTGMLVFWCIAFGIVPIFGLVMLNMVWGKYGGKNLFIMRLVNSICMFAPSVLLLLFLCVLNFI